MKKKRILGLAAMMFSAAGLVACGGTPAESDTTEHKHDYQEVTEECVAATCTTEGKKVTKCTVCGDKKETKVSKKAHTWEEVAAESVAAECEKAGKKVQKCSVCSEKKETAIEALGHDYQDIDGAEGIVKEATCLEKGSKKQKCSRCTSTQEVDTNALGHNWVDDENQAAAETPACTFSGTVLQHCDRTGCTATQEQTVTATGHSFGEPTVTAKDGEKVGYSTEFCPKDSITRVSWDAKEVTTACATPNEEHVVTSGTYNNGEGDAVWENKTEPHITINEDDGSVQFWGRAIGNAQKLDDTGSSSQNDHEHVPDEACEGSFMEYKFKNTTKLESVRLTSYLKPADYLSRNDIWRAAGAENDWTPGYQKGTDGQMHIVNDWRYVMTIDGAQIQLDRTVDTKAIASGGSSWSPTYSAEWYQVPMKTIDLEPGEHTIRISMAGGYRHFFYKWGFETAIDHNHDIKTGEKGESSALRDITCKCSKLAGYELRAADLTEGQKEPSTNGTNDAAKSTRLGKSNIFDDKWNISGISAGMYEVYLEARASSGNSNAGYWNSQTAIDKGDSAGNNGGDTLCHEYKYKIAAHGDLGETETPNYINVGNDTDNYAATGLNEASPAWTSKALCTIPVNEGSTTLTLHNMNNGYAIWVYGVRLVKVSDFVY